MSTEALPRTYACGITLIVFLHGVESASRHTHTRSASLSVCLSVVRSVRRNVVLAAATRLLHPSFFQLQLDGWPHH